MSDKRNEAGILINMEDKEAEAAAGVDREKVHEDESDDDESPSGSDGAQASKSTD